MDNCIACNGPLQEVKMHPGVSYCPKCAIYQVPSRYYFELDLKIRAVGRKRAVRSMPSLNAACRALLQIERRKNNAR